VKTVTRVRLRVQKFPERNINDFLDFPVGQKTLLPIDPGHHGIKNASKKQQIL
jgi:hypothetical protein